MKPEQEERIKKQITDHLTWDASVNANDINVTVKNGKVELRGTVQNAAARLAAGRNAFQVQGVSDVDNYLEIKFPATQSLPMDEEINDHIVRILTWNSHIDASDIMVKTHDNIVTLEGNVGSYWEKYVVDEFVNSVHGVLEVENNIEVRPKLETRDINIKNDIEGAFERTNLINEDNIDVSVDTGMVTLEGAVSSFFVKTQAHNIAIYTTGVVDVVDKLTVK
jgi:osmotically-inducible protein OsmY